MDDFRYTKGHLMCEGLAAEDLAHRFGTPLYVYSASTLMAHADRLAAAFAELSPTICFAVKSNGNADLLRLLHTKGLGMDVVSLGELERAFRADVPMDRIVFAGVGKDDEEIAAALDGGHSPMVPYLPPEERIRYEKRGPVACFNAESEGELRRLSSIAARLNVPARAALRINPDVDANTHAYTTTGTSDNKFGVPLGQAAELFRQYGPTSTHSKHLTLDGLHVHLGSPIYSADPFVTALHKLLNLVGELEAQGTPVRSLDLGGGFAADYQTGQTPPYTAYAAAIVPLLKPLVERGVRIVMEPGRTLVANAGILLTRVRDVKQNGSKTFAVCDAGMHTLIRPALYGSFHFVWPTRVEIGHEPASRHEVMDLPGLKPIDIVGPICESSDFLAQGRELPPLHPGDLLAVFSAGAYGMSMASTYNDQPRPAEVLVQGATARLIRPRQSISDLLAAEPR